jgi:hypothetical protein
LEVADFIALVGVVSALVLFGASQWIARGEERKRFALAQERFQATVHYKIEELAQASLVAVNEVFDAESKREREIEPDLRRRLTRTLDDRARAFLGAMVEDAVTVEGYLQERGPRVIVSWHRMTAIIETSIEDEIRATRAIETYCFADIALRIFGLPRGKEAAGFLEAGVAISPNVRALIEELLPQGARAEHSESQES